jgi:ABC-type transporter Mla subunit MlaD
VLFGSLEVIVPSGVEVDVAAAAIMGSKALRLSGPPPLADAPRIVIHGLVVCGSLNVRDQWRPISSLA